MTLIELLEEEDGGATLILDVTESEKEYLISYAIKDILMKACFNGGIDHVDSSDG